jgi:hypothetical protein
MIVRMHIQASNKSANCGQRLSATYQVNCAICHCSGIFLFFHVWCMILGIGCDTPVRFPFSSTVARLTESLRPSSKISATRDDAIYAAYAIGRKKTRKATATRLFIIRCSSLLALINRLVRGRFSRVSHPTSRANPDFRSGSLNPSDDPRAEDYHCLILL